METIKQVHVENMLSPRGHREVPNQFIIRTEEGKYFQSYRTIIAFVPYTNGHPGDHLKKTVLDINSWNYSVTTGKYRNQFLGEGIEETRRKIKSGEYLLQNLN